MHEDALRAMLHDDPNDRRAFAALAELVRRHAAEPTSPDDPLAALPEEERVEAADLAVWSLAEELAGHPRAWRPLLELGRLSVADDPEGAMRRFTTAAERDADGNALAEGLEVLRDAGMPVEALGLGIGHWRVREHVAEVGRQLVLAALEADRIDEARRHLEALDAHEDTARSRRCARSWSPPSRPRRSRARPPDAAVLRDAAQDGASRRGIPRAGADDEGPGHPAG